MKRIIAPYSKPGASGLPRPISTSKAKRDACPGNMLVS